LRASGFDCSHSGTYRDPVTEKTRQYDIRAVMNGSEGTLALAVECKNLRMNCPLLLSTVPRTREEAFHTVFLRRIGGLDYTTVELAVGSTVYRLGEQVGKNIDQVGRDTNGDLLSNDEQTFEKLNQAVNSSADLVREFGTKRDPPLRRVIVPVVVVPTGLLWQVDYASDGMIVSQPRQVNEVTIFIDHTWPAPGYTTEILLYRISHVELVTFDALANLPKRFFGSEKVFLV